ncbi:amino acid permease [Teratosphaeria destructans]|uniref:Amino acid permease n=1 Tax=Teratosphaeria destructans TaxID=418781 RepID=A0A9W7SJG0_9PEZI|nr:amino acid permease [Teratosphaeria destructans]
MDEHKTVSVDDEQSSNSQQKTGERDLIGILRILTSRPAGIMTGAQQRMAFNVGSRTGRQHVLDADPQDCRNAGHLVTISLGGVVGASIWYAVGSVVTDCGPLGALICFLIVGVDVFRDVYP